jgi:predicted permease
MRSVLHDIRYSARALLASPGLSAISVLALALGVGVTTTMFSIVYGAMLRGASRVRVLGQTLMEAGLLAAAGALIGVALATVGVAWFNGAIAGTGAPFFIDIRVDAPILLFVVAATSLATLLAGMLPGIQVMRSDLNEVLADEARGSSSFRLGRVSRVLVMVQVALSCTLLVGAGLMIRSVVNLGAMDYGFDTDALLTARVSPPAEDYPEVADRELFYDRLLQRFGDHSGVTSAVLMSSLPVAEPPNRRFLIEGETPVELDQRPDANVAVVTPGVFATFQQELIGGRDFNDADTRDGLPVVIVNETFVARYLQGRDPLGARIEFEPMGGGESRWHTVVGVAPDLFMDGPQNEGPDGMYVPLSQSDMGSIAIALRPRTDALSFVAELRREVAALDPDTPVFDLLTMTGRIREQTWFYWVFGTLFAVFGGVALLLASIGLYGVMAFAVRRRTGEIGIRMALGADAGGVLTLVLRTGLLQLGVGLVAGLLMAMGLAGLLETLLFNVAPGDPVTFGAIAGTLLATGLAATLIPARRAARTDPMIALRKQ